MGIISLLTKKKRIYEYTTYKVNFAHFLKNFKAKIPANFIIKNSLNYILFTKSFWR